MMIRRAISRRAAGRCERPACVNMLPRGAAPQMRFCSRSCQEKNLRDKRKAEQEEEQ